MELQLRLYITLSLIYSYLPSPPGRVLHESRQAAACIQTSSITTVQAFISFPTFNVPPRLTQLLSTSQAFDSILVYEASSVMLLHTVHIPTQFFLLL